MFILVRHAHAGEKRLWTALDADRPLSERGRQQAHGLTHMLSMLDRPRMLSSPYLRCGQTLAPLAQRVGSPVATTRLLAPDARISRLDDLLDGLLADPTQHGTVLCTHGETLSGLLRRWHKRGRLTVTTERAAPGRRTLGKNFTEKGAAWVVVAEGSHRAIHYLRPVHVGPVLGPGSDRPVRGPASPPWPGPGGQQPPGQRVAAVVRSHRRRIRISGAPANKGEIDTILCP